jgi:hypothetical protein
MADYAISSAIHFAFSGTKLRLFRRRLLQGNVKHGAEIFNGVRISTKSIRISLRIRSGVAGPWFPDALHIAEFAAEGA